MEQLVWLWFKNRAKAIAINKHLLLIVIQRGGHFFLFIFVIRSVFYRMWKCLCVLRVKWTPLKYSSFVLHFKLTKIVSAAVSFVFELPRFCLCYILILNLWSSSVYVFLYLSFEHFFLVFHNMFGRKSKTIPCWIQLVKLILQKDFFTCRIGIIRVEFYVFSGRGFFSTFVFAMLHSITCSCSCWIISPKLCDKCIKSQLKYWIWIWISRVYFNWVLIFWNENWLNSKPIFSKYVKKWIIECHYTTIICTIDRYGNQLHSKIIVCFKHYTKYK